ncbi:HD domain-containing protein [bacterium]|nr:HD domain-containing protein [bacterium]MBU1881964.1 HD domain-containing protein [bacterium]
MRYCTLGDLTPGMVLGRSIYDASGRLLLNESKALDDRFIKRIEELGFSGAYIDAAGFEAVDPPEVIDPALRARTQAILVESFDTLANISSVLEDVNFSELTSFDSHPELHKMLSVGKIQGQINQIIDDLMDSYTIELPCLLLKSQGRLLVEHSTDTMLIALLIGLNFKFVYRELKQLGLAAMLHDVGKALLGTAGEPPIGPDHPNYKDHPATGGIILLESGTNHYTECAAIQQHHERQDGKGFPNHLIGYNKSPEQSRTYQSGTIYRMAEIISVADAYDTLTSGIYAAPLSPEEAIKTLIKRSFFEFNSYVVNMLAQVVQVFPVGCHVEIVKSSDPTYQNYCGIIKAANTENAHQAELILTDDPYGKATKPVLLSLSGDSSAQLKLLL